MEAGIKKGRRLAEGHWFLSEPEPLDDCAFFYEAYADLSTCRGGDMGPIPWTAVALYSQAKGLDDDVAEVLWEVVKRMDATDRGWALENAEDPAAEED